MTAAWAKVSGRLTIGEVAGAVGATPRALRYYEKIGLLAPSRLNGWVRAYDSTDVRTARDIVELRRLGVTMKDIAAFLDNRPTDAASRTHLIDKLSLRLRALGHQQSFLQNAIWRLTNESHITGR